jgi:hypothetical protein
MNKWNINNAIDEYLEIYAKYKKETYTFKNGRTFSPDNAVDYICMLWFDPTKVYERIELERTDIKPFKHQLPPLLFPNATYQIIKRNEGKKTYRLFFHPREYLERYRSMRAVGLKHWLYVREQATVLSDGPLKAPKGFKTQ